MEHSSDYWYIRKRIPEKALEEIRHMVKGDFVDVIYWKSMKKNLIRVDGKTFARVFSLNRKYLFRGDYTAPPLENDYDSSTNYLTDDGLAGFSITQSGWLTSLFSNYQQSGFLKAIRKFVIGSAYKLVCIVADSEEENKLVNMYKSELGFRKYAATINDTVVMREHYGNEFMDRFIERNGVPFHIFMVAKNVRTSESEIRLFSDYFEAEEYVENTVMKGN